MDDINADDDGTGGIPLLMGIYARSGHITGVSAAGTMKVIVLPAIRVLSTAIAVQENIKVAAMTVLSSRFSKSVVRSVW